MADTPVFVKVEEYKDVLEVMNLIKNKIRDVKDTLEKINQAKSEEDSELEMWHNSIEDVERKMEFVESALFEPTNM